MKRKSWFQACFEALREGRVRHVEGLRFEGMCSVRFGFELRAWFQACPVA